MREEGRRLSQIAENLFTLARADAGNYPVARTHFYLDESLAECVRAAHTLASAKGIHLSLQTEADMQMEADEALIRRTALNLIDNAIKFTSPGGNVSVKARREEVRYLVTVEDTGSGIPNELQSRVFERSFRADKARAHHNDGGTSAGLGLAISRWIAEAHDGVLNLSSSDAKGSIFVASLPVARKGLELRSPSVQSV